MQVHLDALMRVCGIVVAAIVGARNSIRRHLHRILAVGLCLLVGSVWAGSASYYYDELGRLVETVAADGTSVLYRYDAVGNITSVQHDAVSTVGIGGFIPASGPVGTSVTIFGSGFSTTPSTNVVKFNGVTATVTVATATTLTVTVPASATTGTISVTNAAATATSSLSFTVASSGAPTITSFTPTIAAQGAAVTISGTNFQTTLQTNKVSFGNFQAPVSSATATSLATVVPGPATSGKIGVTTPFGVATSTADFFDVPPGFNVTDVQFTGRVTLAGAPLVATTTVAGKIALILFDVVGGSTGTSLQLTNASTSAGTVSVFSPNGSLVASGTIANGLIGLPRLTMTGTYLIVLSPSSPTSLSLSVKQAATLLVDGPAATVTSAGTGYGAFLTFNGTAGQNLGLEASGLTFTGGSGYVTLYVYAPDGTQLPLTVDCFQSNPNGACNLALSNLPLTGAYLISVQNSSNPAITGSAFTLKSDKTATLTSGTAYVLSLLAGQNGRLTFAGTAGQAGVFSFKNVTTSPANQNVVLTVMKPDGTVLTTLNGTSTSNGAEANVSSLPTTGTYTLLVNAAYGLATNLSMTVNPPPDLVADSAAANLSTIATGYSTWMTFNGTAGQNVGVELTGVTFSGGSGYVSVYVYAPDGSSFGSSYCSQSNPNGACNLALSNLPLTGRYQIQVSNPGSPASTGGSVTLKADKTATLTSGTAYSLSLLAGQNGRLTFTGTAGQAAVLSLTNVVTAPANQGVTLTVLNPDGTTLTTFSGTTAAATEWNVPSTGTYTLLVNTAYGLASTMSLMVGAPAVVTVDNASVNLASVATNSSTYLTFNGTAGQNVGVELTGVTLSGGSGYVSVYVYAPDGSSLGSTYCSQSNPNGACSVPLSNLPLTGRYQIQVSNPGSPASTGGSVTVKSDKTAALTSGTAYTLSLLAGQNGRLTFTGTAGQAAVLSLGSVVTTPANQGVTLTVLNPDGTTLTTFSGTTAAATEWNVPSTGTYTLLVNTAYGLASTMSLMVSAPAVVTVDNASVNLASVATNSSTYLTFNGTAGQNVGVELTGVTFSGGSGYVSVYVYAPDGSSFGSSYCSQSNPNGACNLALSNLPLTGRYQIQVSNQVSPASTGGSVTVKSDKTAALTSGTAYTLSLLAGQNGRVTFTGTAGQAAVLSLGSVVTTPANQGVTLTVLNPDGTTLTTLSGTTAAATEWNVPSTGTYTLLVNTAYGLASTMSLMVSPPAVVTVDSTGVNLASVATNSSTYLTFNGTAGQNVGVELTGVTFSGGSGYVLLYVYAPDGSSLGSTYCSQSNPNGACSVPLSNLPLTGRYQIQVSNQVSPASTGGSVTLKSDKTAALTSGTAYTLSLLAGQNGRLTFTGTAGQAAVLSLTNVVTAPANQGVTLTVLNPDGTTLTTLSGTTAAATEWNVPSTGTYTLLVNTAYGLASTMSLMVSAPAVVTLDSASVNLAPVATGSTTYFTFNGTAGQNVGVELTGLTFSGGSGYVTLYVYGPDGSNLGATSCSQSNPSGACSVPVSNLPLTGRYQIQVSNGGYPATTGGSVTLKSDKTAALTSGTAYSLSLLAGQNGRLTFAGTAGQAAVLSLTNVVTAPANQGVTLTVLNPDGTTLTTFSGTTAAATEWNVPSTGTYTLLVNTAYGLASTMSLMVSPPAVVTVDSTAVNLASVATNSSTYLTFNGTVGQNVGVELTGLTFSGGSGYVTLYVYGPDGSNLGATSCSQSNTSGACSVPLSNLPLTGRYQIQVSNSGYPATTGGSVTLKSDKTAALTSGTAYTLSLLAGQNERLTFAGTAAAHTLTIGVPTTTPAGQTVSVTVLDASSNTVSSGSYSTAGGVLTLGTLSAGTYTVIVNTSYGAATTVKLTYQ